MARTYECEARLPFGPVERFCGPMFTITDTYFGDVEVRGSGTVLADLTGFARRTMVRWKADGVPLSRADELAVALGVHPSAIWHDEWWAACAAVDEGAA